MNPEAGKLLITGMLVWCAATIITKPSKAWESPSPSPLPDIRDVLVKKHCQRLNGPKAFNFIEFFKSVNELQNIGQTSAWFCSIKVEKHIYNNLTNPWNNFEKSM